MQIHVARAELTDLSVDAVVVPANSLGLMSEGVAAIVRQRGGPLIEDEVRASAPIAIGAAVVTTGGELFARNVIHAPTTDEPGGKISVESIRRATRASLVAAAARGLATIAFPGMGTGVGGVPIEEAARAMVDEIRDHKQPCPSTIYLVTFDRLLQAAFEEALRNSQQ